MIITKSYARRLIRANRAFVDGACYSDGATYAIIVRHDLQRHDHVFVCYGDQRETASI
jgi:hypothetical protein